MLTKITPNIVRSWRMANNGSRSVTESVLVPEVRKTLDSWLKRTDSDFILIGALGFGYWGRPRETTDVATLVRTVPNAPTGFKKIRPHAVEDLSTGVEVETLTPEHLKLTKGTVDLIDSHTIDAGGFKVANPILLISLKAHRFSRRDQGDIEDLIETLKLTYGQLDTELPQDLPNRQGVLDIQKESSLRPPLDP